MRLRRRIWAAAVLAALLCPGTAAGASNPFLPGNAPAPRVVRNLSGVSVLAHWQRALQSRMTALMDISTPAAVGTLTLVAGIYGVVHALGPGHQKTLLAGLVLSQGATLGQAATAAFLTAALHAGSSIVLIGGTALALERASLTAFERGRELIQRGAALALVALALGMLVRRVREAAHRRRHRLEAGHDASTCPVCSRMERAREKGASPWGAVVAGGIVPCPGAALLLLLGISAGHLGLGVLAVLALSLGMGVTLFAVEMGAMGVRRGLIPLGKGDPRRGDRIRTVLEVGGSLLVLAFAVLLAF